MYSVCVWLKMNRHQGRSRCVYVYRITHTGRFKWPNALVHMMGSRSLENGAVATAAALMNSPLSGWRICRVDENYIPTRIRCWINALSAEYIYIKASATVCQRNSPLPPSLIFDKKKKDELKRWIHCPLEGLFRKVRLTHYGRRCNATKQKKKNNKDARMGKLSRLTLHTKNRKREETSAIFFFFLMHKREFQACNCP